MFTVGSWRISLRGMLCAGFVACGVGCATQAASVSTQDDSQDTRIASAMTPTRENGGVLVADITPGDDSHKILPVTREDVILWSVRGTSDDVIIDRIERSGSVFPMLTSEEIHLRDAGISDEVIRAMKGTQR